MNPTRALAGRLRRRTRGELTRLLLLGSTVGAAVCLIPWTGYLAVSLPERYSTHQWRLAWVGFDTALAFCFAAAAWLDWRRRRLAVPMHVVTAVLLCCDAWFDVMLESGSRQRWASILMALVAEVPLAVSLLLRARGLSGVRGHRHSGDEHSGDEQIETMDASRRRMLDHIGALRLATQLTEAELARFAVEYDELLARYRVLHDDSGATIDEASAPMAAGDGGPCRAEAKPR